jgi:hypothetical protein
MRALALDWKRRWFRHGGPASCRMRPPISPRSPHGSLAFIRPSFGFHLWTVENLTAAVSRNLGVRLSPVGARSVIAAEHARRRPDYYRRLAWKRRGRKWDIRRQRLAFQ